MPSYYSLTVNDNSISTRTGAPEKSTTEMVIDTLTPANVANAATLAGNLKVALNGICIGENAQEQLVYSRDLLSNAPADSPHAQRENKWLVRYIDAVTSQKFQLSFPCADLTKVGENSEFVPLGSGPCGAFKTAFEAFVKSPANPAHAVTVISVQFVGRNS